MWLQIANCDSWQWQWWWWWRRMMIYAKFTFAYSLFSGIFTGDEFQWRSEISWNKLIYLFLRPPSPIDVTGHSREVWSAKWMRWMWHSSNCSLSLALLPTLLLFPPGLSPSVRGLEWWACARAAVSLVNIRPLIWIEKLDDPSPDLANQALINRLIGEWVVA